MPLSLRFFVAPFVCLLTVSCARSEDAKEAAEPAFEAPPAITAKEVVHAPLLLNENYKIADAVSIASFYFRFHLDATNYGPYDIDSLDLLQTRIFEIGVLSKAGVIDGKADFAQGAKSNITDTAKATAKTVITPVKSAKALGSALEDTGRAAFDFVRMKNRNQPKDSLLTGEQKRKDAHGLGLDVYSTNPAVQAYLDELAKSRATGGRLIDVGLQVGTFVMPFGTPVGAAIMAGKYREKLADKLDTLSPMELYRYNDKILKKMDVQSRDRENFLEFAGLTPKQKTEIVADLKTLENMPEKTAILVACAEPHPPEGLWQCQCADVLAKYNKTVETLQWAGGAGDALLVVTSGGKQLTIVPGDLVYWNEDLKKSVDRSSTIAGATQREFVTPARVTARARKEIEARGFVVRERFLSEAEAEAK